jgi:hypothetical protein
LRGVAPSLSSCGTLAPLPKHPLTQAASRAAMSSFMVDPSHSSAFCATSYNARAGSFGIVLRSRSASQTKSYTHEHASSTISGSGEVAVARKNVQACEFWRKTIQ